MRVCFPLTTRGNYAKVKSTLHELHALPGCEVLILVGGALLLKHYGEFEALIKADGFEIAGRLPYIVEGETLANMTQSAANGVAEMGHQLERLSPDIAFIVADRYEALALAQAALCMGVPIAHLEGGESSGSIDDRIRHAISMLAEVHFPATPHARDVLQGFGIPGDQIHVVGTPSLDQLHGLDLEDKTGLAKTLGNHGRGAEIDLDADYIVVSQHPVVTEYGDAERQFAETADAVQAIGLPTVWVLPNLDAGAQEVANPIRALTQDPAAPPVRTVGGLAFLDYAPLLKGTRCLVGNTSSALREGAFLGVPAVNIGTRQTARERGANVIDADYNADDIVRAAERQIARGPYPRDTLYGDGQSGRRIAEILASGNGYTSQTAAA